MNDTKARDAGVILLKESSHADGPGSTAVKENVRMPQRLKSDTAWEQPPADAVPAQPPKSGRRLWVMALLAAAGAVGIGTGVAYYYYALAFESTDDAFVEGHIVAVSPHVAGHVAQVHVIDNQWVNQGDLIAELDARDFRTRLAVAEAALTAAKAALKSRSLGVDMMEITSTAGVDEASAVVDGAKAAVETAHAAVATAKSQMAQAQAQLSAAQAGLKHTQADLQAAEARQQRAAAFLKRIESLVPEHAAAQDTLDEAVAAERVTAADVSAMRQRINSQEAAVRQAEAAVAAAESGVHQAESGVTGQLAAVGRAEALRAATRSAPKQVAQSQRQSDAAQADVERAQAEVDQAQLNLSYTKIYAPIAGHVTRKSVEQGAYVQVGQPLLALVDPDVWVVANFKETQLDKMRPGQPVTVTLDPHPGVKLAAHVDSIQCGSGARFSLLPPENATGNFVKVVQRVPVKIVFDDRSQVRQFTLGPGMSVLPTVKVNEPGKTLGHDGAATSPR